jgi:Xaa-Pro aminopeptidase
MAAIDLRLGAVREQMAAGGYHALVVPRANEYLGEYLPPHHERLRWLSGFTGSAGTAIVLPDRAALFVDGRYTVQVRQQVPDESFEIHHLLDEPPIEWLVQQLPAGATVAIDARLHSSHWYRQTAVCLAAAGAELAITPENLIDRCWLDRPAALVRPALLLGEEFTGESSAHKRRRIGTAIAASGADAALIFAPDSISWLLNVRGTDVPLMPVLQGMAVLAANGALELLVAPGRIPEGFAAHVGSGVTRHSESDAERVLAGFGGQTVLVDPNSVNAWSQRVLETAGCKVLAGDDPVVLPRACKNRVELAGTRRAHVRDAVAEISFLAWLDAEVAAGRLHDEAVLAETLLRFRQRGERFHGLSFDTISAAGGNAAMCHYNHLDGSPGRLEMNSVYLVDSGAHYTDGTTDITRTVAIGDPGAEIKRMFTLVLKGHIALDRARFPRGTTGSQLDALARQYLWQEGFDYDHGTGHGVGVFLSVHEAPQRISRVPNTVALRPGMIISNEPGYYRDGAYGIRCENLVVVRDCDHSRQETPMLEFEAITLVPFDQRLLDAALLQGPEIDWLNAYHRRVADTVGPLLGPAERQWLQQATRPFSPVAVLGLD